MSDLRMELIRGQLQDIEENVRSIKATWGNTIMTLDNIKSGLKADRQKAIDEAYQKGFEAGQHEATTLEYQQGLNDAWGTIIKIALIPYAERSEIFDGQQDILSIVQKFSPSEVTVKLREYEQQKADKRIMIGDGLVTKHGGVNGIALSNEVNRCVYVWREDCVAYEASVDEWKKTGKTYPQVAELHEAMKGEQRICSCSTCKYSDGSDVSKCSDCFYSFSKGYSMWEPKEGAE